jgi:hypothetical protein
MLFQGKGKSQAGPQPGTMEYYLQEQKKRDAASAASAAQQQATGAEAYKQSQEGQIEAQRKQMIADLFEQSQGRGNSAAMQQAEIAKQQNLQNALAYSATQRGSNAGLTQRNAMLAQQQGAMNIDQQAQLARLQEIQNARSAFLGDLGSRYAADKGYATQIQTAQMQAQAQKDAASSQASSSLFGSLLGAAGTVAAGAAMASDENLKEDIKSGSGKIQSFLDAIAAHDYKYRPEAGEDSKRHVSPMAQELEKSEVGKGMVVDTPSGKMVDYGKGFGAILAAQSELNERLKRLEGKK